MKLKYKFGSAVTPKEDGSVLIIHCCNDIGAMGSGFVVPLCKQYPEVKSNYSAWFGFGKQKNTWTSDAKPYMSEVQIVQTYDDNVAVANIIGQRGCGIRTICNVKMPPVMYHALYVGMLHIRQYIEARSKFIKNPVIVCPRMGAGLAGGTWQTVEHYINQVFEDTDIPVFCYDIERQGDTVYEND